MVKDLHMSKNPVNLAKDVKKLKKTQKNVNPLQAFFVKFANDWSMNFAGALAYSLLTAVVPIIIAMISLLGFALGPQQIQTILQTMNTILPALSSQQDVIQHSLDQLSKQAGFLALIAILLAVFGGSRLFVGLEGFLDIVYRVRPRTFIPQNIMAIFMMLLFIILVPIMFFAATLPSFILQSISSLPILKTVPFFFIIASNPIIIYLAGACGGLLAAFILFLAIYIVVPNQRIRFRQSWLGAIVSAVALELFLSVVFPLYATYFLRNYVGQAGFAVVLLVFFYYFAIILILGAEINAFFLEQVRPLPNDLATFVSTMAGKLNRDRPETEAPSHVNPEPTNRADKAHIALTREQEQENQATNREKQEQIVSPQPALSTTKVYQNRKKLSGNVSTVLSVILGSLFTVIIEMLRQYNESK